MLRILNISWCAGGGTVIPTPDNDVGKCFLLLKILAAPVVMVRFGPDNGIENCEVIGSSRGSRAERTT